MLLSDGFPSRLRDARESSLSDSIFTVIEDYFLQFSLLWEFIPEASLLPIQHPNTTALQVGSLEEIFAFYLFFSNTSVNWFGDILTPHHYITINDCHYVENYDGLDDGPLASSLGMEKQRKEILDNAAGKTLEVGIGTGINLKYYNFSNLESLTGVDLSRKMLEQAQKKRIANLGKNINFEVANVEDLPFPDSYFDTVVDTFSMCVYPDPRKAISEMKRVLKDDGKLLLLEHTRSKMPLLAAYQDVSANSVAHLGKGCFWNQNIDEIIQSAHLDVVDRKEHLSGLITSYQITKRWSQDS